MTSFTMSTSSLLNTRAPVVGRNSSRPARAVRVFASQEKQAQNQGPRDAIMKALGAAAAVQLALTGAAFADLPDVKPFVKPQGGFLVGKPPGVEDAKAAADKFNPAKNLGLPNPFKGDGGDVAKQLDSAPVPTASDVQDLGSKAKDAVGGGGFKLPNLGGGLPGSGTDSGVPKNS